MGESYVEKQEKLKKRRAETKLRRAAAIRKIKQEVAENERLKKLKKEAEKMLKGLKSFR